jgi:hypothetical protein
MQCLLCGVLHVYSFGQSVATNLLNFLLVFVRYILVVFKCLDSKLKVLLGDTCQILVKASVT